MNRMLLAALTTVGLLGTIVPTATAQDQHNIPAVVLWACYVPLTGTVYRISPDGTDAGLRTACTSTSHVKFSWNEQGPPGVSGYEVVTSSVQKTYFDFFNYIILRQRCNQYQVGPYGGVASCIGFVWDSYARRDASPVPGTALACPAGKKVIGAVAGDGVRITIATDGTSATFRANTEPRVTQEREGSLTPSYAGPPDNPDTFSIQVICASAN